MVQAVTQQFPYSLDSWGQRKQVGLAHGCSYADLGIDYADFGSDVGPRSSFMPGMPGMGCCWDQLLLPPQGQLWEF